MRILTTKKMNKNQVIDSIQDMPDEFSVDDLIERFIVLRKIEEGRDQSKEGKFYTEEEAKKKLQRWLK